MKRLMITNRKPPRFFGNTIVLLYWKNYAVLTIGPHWPFSLGLVTSIILLSAFLLIFLYITMPLAFYIGCGVVILQLSWYVSSIIWGPGHPSFEIREEHLDIVNKDICRWWRKCKIVRDADVEHWLDWNVCVIGYDHHWAWTSKCVGKWNFIFFNAFLVSTWILFVYMFWAFMLIMVLIQHNQI